ncbi:bifunctional tRNA (5-methylaminomethyl-2-thiouridine)(34)-methyltransferase MnmD/FAD-dependent 5-carboxymethylaminomethyl-2-thiouridine(34) oxidoreductase MnmC [Neisseria sp. Ec49-e6-T10]|uniref:bifunctional tRNA (5-methylaminomethyl-2-thiouridine)(34)-methyltransferase MnmD/FAD-dependent 5-carboxymethylaminomethyl-2-thiouridine(34) oxidoreductase MnmC n=1 Tax=Neisseria sp. Ec49-e6-T10 TaxID=3140744 RepID=UPI003EC0A619
MFISIDWQDKLPTSAQFDDVYFSKSNGLEESSYVFLRHNHLPKRFTQLSEQEAFSVGELGFGTGLNFFNTVHCFLNHAPSTAHLTFFSFECAPLKPEDLKKSFHLWQNQLTDISDSFLTQYLSLSPGLNHLSFDQGRITLLLFIGDVAEGLSQITPPKGINAWFLDGFAPSKNPQMWQLPLFEQMAKLCANDATFSTFTSAGWVRKNIEQAGFKVFKTQGFAQKREMCFGSINEVKPANQIKPWFCLPTYHSPTHVLIIGAGIAGASTAHTLAQKGISVTVLEAEEHPAHGASGNHQGILYTKLSAHFTPQTQLLLAGFGYSLRLLQQLLPEQESWRQTGIIHLDYDKEAAKRHLALDELNLPSLFQHVNQEQIEQLANIKASSTGGLYFPLGAWINPPSLVNKLLQHPNISVLTQHKVDKLYQTEQEWVIECQQGQQIKGSHVVICQGYLSGQFDYLKYLPLTPIRGQVTHIKATDASKKLAIALNAEGYISPAWQGIHCLGASFIPMDTDSSLRIEEQLDNLNHLQQLSSDLYQALNLSKNAPLLGKAAIRCDSTDHLPLVGPIVDMKQFTEVYADLALDKNRKLDAPCPYLPNLYINTAHGTKGLATAPLCGQIIANMITHTPLPITQTLLNALAPHRFLLKSLIQGRYRKPSQIN